MFKIAKEKDANKIDILRKQTRDFHIKYKPEIFKPSNSFDEEYSKFVINSEDSDILVYEDEEKIIAYMIVKNVVKPENQYCYEIKYLSIEDFGVDESHRNKGIGSKLFNYCKEYAKGKGLNDIKLNVWDFNKNAFKFYEKLGFKIERLYLDYAIE